MLDQLVLPNLPILPNIPICLPLATFPSTVSCLAEELAETVQGIHTCSVVPKRIMRPLLTTPSYNGIKAFTNFLPDPKECQNTATKETFVPVE